MDVSELNKNMMTLASKIKDEKDEIETESDTRRSFIEPFLQHLGYNPQNIREVKTEFTADVANKNGEKVDYAILFGGKPAILIECKKYGERSNKILKDNFGQLQRYYGVVSAKFGILTDGVLYQFFADFEKTNQMDSKPYFEFNVLNFTNKDIEELFKYTKEAFNVGSILEAAELQKNTRAIMAKLKEWSDKPSEDFVKIIWESINSSNSRFVDKAKKQFTELTKTAFNRMIEDAVDQRYDSAKSSKAAEVPSERGKEEGPISDTEYQAFYAIKSMLQGLVPTNRVFIRNQTGYSTILLDDNQKKGISWLYMREGDKEVVFDKNDRPKRKAYKIENIDDLYKYKEQFQLAVKNYLTPNEEVAAKTAE